MRQQVTLNDIASPTPNAIASGPFGSAIGSRYFRRSGVPVIRGGNLSSDIGVRLDERDLAFLDADKAREFSRSTARRGDLIFTSWGTVDQVGIIDSRSKYDEYVISNKQMKVTADPTKVDPLFLYYLFSAPTTRTKILSRAIGSSVPGFNLGQLRAFEIELPQLAEQRAISGLLNVLDEKIELNRKTNSTLSQIAFALFQSWFVDFDPVVARDGRQHPVATTRFTASFPSSFDDSPVGLIPHGWKVETLARLATQHRDICNPLRFPAEAFEHFSLPAFDNGETARIEKGAEIKSNKHLVPDRAVLISKLNPHIPRVWLTDRSEQDMRRICSTEFLVFTPLRRRGRAFLYCLFSSEDFTAQFQGYVTGTSNSHQRVQARAIADLPVVVPSEKCEAEFDQLVEPLLNMILANRRETRTLAALRDTLLPKLMSGAIRIDDIRKSVEAVA